MFEPGSNARADFEYNDSEFILKFGWILQVTKAMGTNCDSVELIQLYSVVQVHCHGNGNGRPDGVQLGPAPTRTLWARPNKSPNLVDHSSVQVTLKLENQGLI